MIKYNQFGSWDGEEWGLYESVYFNEKRKEYINKIVVYINFDMTVTGQNMVFYRIHYLDHYYLNHRMNCIIHVI